MKISVNWLMEFIDLPTRDPEELKAVLEDLGHEVEGYERLVADWTGVQIAEVLTVEQHPDADRVRLCTVTTGGEPIDVVCGAWNFEAGAIVAFANPGAVLAGGFEIGVRDIRGVTSNGMICSERELDLGDDHDGIIVLEPDAPVGADFREWVDLPDVVLDLTITPNRPDAMSVLGVARDLAAHYGLELRMPVDHMPTVPGSASVGARIDDPSGCLRFTARELQDVTVGPSPHWMRHRLRISGMRPISNAVDVTNYVMWELGHPLHAFDIDRIAGSELVIRRAEDGETMTTLDDVERTLTTADLVICDDTGPTSMSGTMGGADSEVHAGSTRVLLEAATWDPPTIMRMSRRHGLRSEASARFERGVDPELPLIASARAAHLLTTVGGGNVLETPTDTVAVPFERPVIELSSSQVERVLGPGFDEATIAARLRSLGLGVEGSDPMHVEIPGFRPDLERPIDLVEEVARLHGLEHFPETVPHGTGSGWSTEQRRTARIRSILTGAGISQALHLSFIGDDDLDAFAFPPGHPARRTVGVRNPLREEEAVLRTTLLPGLLRSARYNLSHGAGSVALFEIGKVFFDEPDVDDERIPHQPDRLGIVVVGPLASSPIEGPGRPSDVYTATSLWRTISAGLGVDGTISQGTAPGLHPGRCAVLAVDGIEIGFCGELHPTTAEHYDLPGRVAVLEIDLDRVVAPVALAQNHSPSTYPRVEFDLAFSAPLDLPAASLLDAVRTATDDVERAEVFDEYTGLGGGRKSIGVRVRLRPSDRTLTNEDVAPLRQAMIEAAAAVGGELRGA